MDISIIIVNWNTGKLLRACLDSLYEATLDLEYEVIVIDNASSDQSIAHAEGSPQKFLLLAQRKNLGFARANNVGVRQSSGDVILLLNPDTEALPGSIRSLFMFLQRNPDVAAVGPRLLNTDGTVQSSCRRFPSLRVLVFMLLKIHRIFPNMRIFGHYMMSDFSYTRDRNVDQIMGAAMAIPRPMFDAIGFLDEGYWIWFEEVDWCHRTHDAGKEIWFTPSAEILHHGGSSFVQVLPVKKEWRFARSAIRYTRKHIGIFAAGVLAFCVLPALLIDALSFAYKRRKSA